MSFSLPAIITTLTFALHWCIILGLGTRILLRRKARGITVSWLLIIISIPFAGAIAYLFVGELWLPHKRIKKYSLYSPIIKQEVAKLTAHWNIDQNTLHPLSRILYTQAHQSFDLPALTGNSVQMYSTAHDCFKALVDDINNAEDSIVMLFYIWDSSGLVGDVERALIGAAERGISCKIMVDSAGSARFLRSLNAIKLRGAGIEITELLPVGRFRFLFKRIDIRNHRKIIAIDQTTAYTGSMNMVDPAFFGAHKRVGQWVDVMARIQGPASALLDLLAKLDRAIEREDTQEVQAETSAPRRDSKFHIEVEPDANQGQSAIQIVPSGPDQSPRITHDMLLTLIYNAEQKLIVTTPYFIPGESMLAAMTAASLRGVEVTLIVPAKVDSKVVARASRSYFQDLLDAGVTIHQYQHGLLHSKTVTADNQVAMLGTVNMDKRSFWINFEVSMFVYDPQAVAEIQSLQESYIQGSNAISPELWAKNSIPSRLLDNLAQLFSPIL